MENVRALSELSPGEKAIIQKIAVQGSLRRRLLDMGIIAGSPLQVIKVAPLGDPIDIKIKGYHLSLRKEEARGILVKG